MVGQSAVLRGRVLDATNESPIPGAYVELVALKVRAQSDSSGAFQLRGIPAGVHQISVRAIGHDAMTARLQIAASDTIATDFLLSATATKLGTVKVSVSRSERYRVRLQGFEERRKIGLGRFLDGDFFEKNRTRALGVLLVSRIAGIRTIKTLGGEMLVGERYGSRCRPQIIVNGIVRDDFDLESVTTDEVIGFEYYSVASTPAEFARSGTREGGSQCGTAVFWLK